MSSVDHRLMAAFLSDTTAGFCASRADPVAANRWARDLRRSSCCDQFGDVIGEQELCGDGWSPRVQPARVVEGLRLPQLIVDDDVEVRVILGEVPGWIPDVPEIVRSDVV